MARPPREPLPAGTAGPRGARGIWPPLHRDPAVRSARKSASNLSSGRNTSAPFLPVIIPNKINQFQSPARGAAGLRERPAPLRSAPRPGTARGPARPGRYRGRYRGPYRDRAGPYRVGPARPGASQPTPPPAGGRRRSCPRCRAGCRYLVSSCSATWGWRQPHAWLKAWLCRLRKGEDALRSRLPSSPLCPRAARLCSGSLINYRCQMIIFVCSQP